MSVSLCKHAFPVQPPHGSMIHPGDCTGCGTTWNDVQRDLLRQEEIHRATTAHEGDCQLCGQPRMLFLYQRREHPADAKTPPVRWLCTPCWGAVQATEEATGFLDFHDVFDRGTDDQLQRFVFGGVR